MSRPNCGVIVERKANKIKKNTKRKQMTNVLRCQCQIVFFSDFSIVVEFNRFCSNGKKIERHPLSNEFQYKILTL